jgi:hypothetical protein
MNEKPVKIDIELVKASIRKRIKNARKNALRQKLKELTMQPTRVSSSFWFQVESDYRLQLKEMNHGR